MNSNEKKSIQPVHNPEYTKALAEMRANYNEETQNRLLNVALRCKFVLPAVIDTKTRIVADKNNKVHFDDRPQAQFLLMEHEKLGTYLPAFSEIEEIMKFDGNDVMWQGVEMTFPQVAHLVEQMPNVNGFVVNPLGDPLPFSRELLNEILQQIIAAQNKDK